MCSSDLTSDRPYERARGLEILERMAKADVFGARRELAAGIRKDDPVRARQLLEDSRRTDPGGAIVPLAQMLIAGEGGPADPKRALSLLKDVSDSWMAKGMLGQLALEGKWVPRNVQEAVRLIDLSSGYDYDARIEVLQLLAANPTVRVEYPEHLLFDAAEAAELDEPGAMQALIARVSFAHSADDAANQARDVAEPFSRQALRHRVFEPRDRILLDRLEQLIFAAKATIDIANRHACSLRHRRHREVGDAATPQEPLGGLHDPGERGAAAPLLRSENMRRGFKGRHSFRDSFLPLPQDCQNDSIPECECKLHSH